jgi:F-type H+-transporting ATPase subunit a
MTIWNLIAIFDPLEQFDVIKLLPSISYSLTNLTLILLLNLALIAFFVYATIYPNQSQTIAPHVLADGVRSVFDLVAGLAESNIRVSKQVYFPILLYIFVVILMSNLLGMIPFSYTVTSSFIWTFFVSLALFIGLNLLGIYQHAYAIFAFGMPTGSPLILAPLIAAVEFISYFSRIFSLSIRLFANMMAGHTLLKILIGFSWTMINSQALFAVLALLPWIVVTLVMGLEFVISFLQAYVFVVLICLYIHDIIQLH